MSYPPPPGYANQPAPPPGYANAQPMYASPHAYGNQQGGALQMPPPQAVPMMDGSNNGSYNPYQAQPIMAMPVGPAGVQPGRWAVEICGCFGDCESALLSWCCPCVVFGQNINSINAEKNAILYGALYFGIIVLLAVMSSLLGGMGLVGFLALRVVIGLLGGLVGRTHTREFYQINGGKGEDFFMHCCLYCCALSQERTQIKRFPPENMTQMANPSQVQQAPQMQVQVQGGSKV